MQRIFYSLLLSFTILVLPHIIGTPLYDLYSPQYIEVALQGSGPPPYWTNGLPLNYLIWYGCPLACTSHFKPIVFLIDFVFLFSFFYLLIWSRRRKPD